MVAISGEAAFIFSFNDAANSLRVAFTCSLLVTRCNLPQSKLSNTSVKFTKIFLPLFWKPAKSFWILAKSWLAWSNDGCNPSFWVVKLSRWESLFLIASCCLDKSSICLFKLSIALLLAFWLLFKLFNSACLPFTASIAACASCFFAANSSRVKPWPVATEPWPFATPSTDVAKELVPTDTAFSLVAVPWIETGAAWANELNNTAIAAAVNLRPFPAPFASSDTTTELWPFLIILKILFMNFP